MIWGNNRNWHLTSSGKQREQVFCPLITKVMYPNSSGIYRSPFFICLIIWQNLPSCFDSWSSLTNPAAFLKSTVTLPSQAHTPAAMARCVFPVPELLMGMIFLFSSTNFYPFYPRDCCSSIIWQSFQDQIIEPLLRREPACLREPFSSSSSWYLLRIQSLKSIKFPSSPKTSL